MAGIATPIAVSTDVDVAGNPRVLYGWSIHETAGAVATVLIRAGSVSGQIVAAIELAADASSTEWFEGGVYVPDSLCFDVAAGAVEGSLYVG